MTEAELKAKAKAIRLSVLDMVTASGSSHIGAAFSIVDILTVLYFDVLNIDLKNPKWAERDRFLLSKGHGGAALYATLSHRGFFNLANLANYARDNSALAGHVVKDSMPGVETTAGSLGHGLSMAIGIALALKSGQPGPRVFVLVGDGECNEGSVWEAALSAPQFKLDNLTLIVDRNREQSLGKSDDILNLEPFGQKWKDFGWNCLECRGHDFKELAECFSHKNIIPNKPTVVIANTQKGKGVSYMEKDALAWHYKTPKDELLKQAREELNA